MLCTECQEKITNSVKIGNNDYCKTCVNNFKLSKCPISECDNIISTNGYNHTFNIDHLECDTCGYQVCENCLVNTKYNKQCSVCYWNSD